MNVAAGFEEYEKFYDFSALFQERVDEQSKYRYIPGLSENVVEVEEPLEKPDSSAKTPIEQETDDLKD